MVSALDSGWSSLGSSPSRRRYFLEQDTRTSYFTLTVPLQNEYKLI